MIEIKFDLRSLLFFGGTVLVVAAGTFLVVALMLNIFERKSEARTPYVRLVDVTENDTDPAK